VEYDAKAVIRPQLERFENQKVERAL
jgi:hypothetical protein